MSKFATDINKYAAESVDEYPEVAVEWRRVRLRAFIEQAYRFGLTDGLSYPWWKRLLLGRIIPPLPIGPPRESK